MIGATGAILYASAVLDPAIRPDRSAIHRDLGRPDPVAGGHRGDHPDSVCRPPDGQGADSLPDRDRFSPSSAARWFIRARWCRISISKTLVFMRTFQTAGLAFLFVPISTIAYMTLPRELNGDGAALFAMFRNIFGSIGIALANLAGHRAHPGPSKLPVAMDDAVEPVLTRHWWRSMSRRCIRSAASARRRMTPAVGRLSSIPCTGLHPRLSRCLLLLPGRGFSDCTSMLPAVAEDRRHAGRWGDTDVEVPSQRRHVRRDAGDALRLHGRAQLRRAGRPSA